MGVCKMYLTISVNGVTLYKTLYKTCGCDLVRNPMDDLVRVPCTRTLNMTLYAQPVSFSSITGSSRDLLWDSLVRLGTLDLVRVPNNLVRGANSELLNKNIFDFSICATSMPVARLLEAQALLDPLWANTQIPTYSAPGWLVGAEGAKHIPAAEKKHTKRDPEIL